MPRKILVVDDDKLTLEVVKDLLETAGYQVATLSAPRLIANVIVREQPDLILVDLRMPEMPGDLLVEFARKFHLKVPMVLFSAADETTLARLAEETGARGYIKKTDDHAELLAKVKRFLQQ